MTAAAPAIVQVSEISVRPSSSVLAATGAFVKVEQNRQAVEHKMKWTYHHDPEGVEDFPDQQSFDTRILNYWTNEAGVRIGLFGHAKDIAIFTYRNGDLNFKFEAWRSSPGPMEKGDRTLGPQCSVTIRLDKQVIVDGKTVTLERKHLLDGYSRRDIMNEITQFLYTYRDLEAPPAVGIEEVLFPFENQ